MTDRLAPPQASGAAAGWYPDPIESGVWRWWDGWVWTAHRSAPTVAAARKPRLPRWLSPPVATCLPLVVIGVIALAFYEPVAVLSGLVPLLIVLPTIAWLDRVEPEPRHSRIHAVLWGASTAIVVSLIVNMSVMELWGETVTAVFGAPFVEEALKGLGIVWAVRRCEVDGPIDGVVYAAWVALGFAVVEDMTYFADAPTSGIFVQVFVLRALLTPFAHPLFTMWTGLAIGRQVAAGRKLWPGALWGYGLAVVAHMAWNGSLVAAEPDEGSGDNGNLMLLLLVVVLFVALFVAVFVKLRAMRRTEQRRFEQQLPFLVRRYGLTPEEQLMFTSWKQLVGARRSLPRRQRRAFDAVHSAIARLAAHHRLLTRIDRETEAILVQQLEVARAALSQKSSRRG
jgi:RsiW-degrading membrane proteinase PrsW (M82 family)